MAEQLDTHRKALTLNLDATIFGTFAEIGAGQEVARCFLQVGAASMTVAKSISAYDKAVSDHLYGQGTRYVSRRRLEAMLDREWDDLQRSCARAVAPHPVLRLRRHGFGAQLRRDEQIPRVDGRPLSDRRTGAADVLLHVIMRIPQSAPAGGTRPLGVNLSTASFTSGAAPTSFCVRCRTSGPVGSRSVIEVRGATFALDRQACSSNSSGPASPRRSSSGGWRAAAAASP
jgi:hypothetical protein